MSATSPPELKPPDPSVVSSARGSAVDDRPGGAGEEGGNDLTSSSRPSSNKFLRSSSVLAMPALVGIFTSGTGGLVKGTFYSCVHTA